MNRMRLAAIGVACFSTATLAYCACSGGSSGGMDAPPDAGVDAAQDAIAVDVLEASTWVLPDGGFDGSWPVVSPPTGLDCGPGCRIALNRGANHPLYYGHFYTSKQVLDSNGDHLLLAEIGSNETRLIKSAAGLESRIVEGAITDGYASFLWSTFPKSEVHVVRLSDGAEISFQGEDFNVIQTAVNGEYVFWMRDGAGLFRGDLTTGETKQLTTRSFSCDRLCETNSGLVCSSTDSLRVEFIDQETGAITHLDDGGALQVEGACSPDRRRVVWIDYRDPPGRDSVYMGYRSAGEVYMRDFETQTTTRITHDSPDSPKGKIYPSAGDDSVIWYEATPPCPANPDSADTLRNCGTTLVWKRLDTGRVCRLLDAKVGSRTSLHGHHLYGYWLEPTQNELYLADLDMDSPALSWTCE